ncbi:hypothetical protein L5D93_08625 [Paenibacillus thiaminolyticus]|nr:hypothetical protein [Paenibacillus thiaminolyticus]
MKNRLKEAAIAAFCMMLLFGSMNVVAEAASQSTNKAAAKPAAASDASKQKQIEAETDRLIKASKNPGDLFVLYVNDKTLNPQEHITFFPVPYTFDKYDDYVKQVSQLTTPLLIKPDGLPEGYVFSKAEVKQPMLPNGQKYREKLKSEAKGRLFHSKRLSWTEAGEVKLEFKKEKDVIRLEYDVFGDIAELLVPDFFAKGKPDQGGADIYTYSAAFEMKTLKWQDQEKGIEYRVSVDKSSPLGRKDLLSIAETMIQE